MKEIDFNHVLNFQAIKSLQTYDELNYDIDNHAYFEEKD